MLAILIALLLAAVYSWTFYNLPVIAVGIRDHRRERTLKGRVKDRTDNLRLPAFSVVIPAKDEESVISRLLNALLHQNYPKEKVEVLIVEDGSVDSTAEVCREFARRSQGQIEIVQAEQSLGKPSALNRALGFAKGDIIAVFDADNIPERDALLNAARHFQDDSIVAVQGRTLTVNSDASMLARFVAYEESMWFEGYLRGKDALNLFVHLKGSCQFVRKEALRRLEGWDESCLSEDMELSARLTEERQRIKYAGDVRSWQESPESLAQMFRQRIRWFRGTMEVALKFSRLMKKPSLKAFDAEVTLFGPFVLIVSFMAYLLSPLVASNLGESTIFAVTVAGWFALTISLVLAALALLYIAKPRSKRDALWLPFIYAYWSFQAFLATWAFIEVACGASRDWRRTVKTGRVTSVDSDLLTQLETVE